MKFTSRQWKPLFDYLSNNMQVMAKSHPVVSVPSWIFDAMPPKCFFYVYPKILTVMPIGSELACEE